MPKRADAADTIDPVRSRLAELAAGPAAPPAKQEREKWGGQENGRREEEQAAIEVEREEPRQPARPRKASKYRMLTVNRKIMVTEEEAEQIERTTRAISEAFGSKVTYSQVSRALWGILASSEDSVRLHRKRAPNLSVPSKGDHVAMAEYEDALAEFLAMALKRS